MALDFCSCGSLKINGKCTNKGCPSKKGHPSTIKNNTIKSKGWKIDGAFMDFDEPITFEEAVKRKQELDKLLFGKGEPDGKKDNSV